MKKQRAVAILFSIVLSCLAANAQEDVQLPKPTATTNRYVGFNVNPLLSQMLPLSNVQPLNSLYSIMVRRYFDKEIGIRTGFGVVAGDNNTNSLRFSLSLTNGGTWAKTFTTLLEVGQHLKLWKMSIRNLAIWNFFFLA
ncbi:MAG: hypothetical protein EXR21_01225 [Flavobacteriaceae bacterium]|nr:hypothetical protein [Flavobacteriaceae bacterium]